MIVMTVFSVFKFVAVATILVAMVMILLGIGHLSHNEDAATKSQTNAFMREVQENEDVIGESSVFRKFLLRNQSLGYRGESIISRREDRSNRG